MTEINVPDTVLGSSAQGDGMAIKGFADAHAMAMKRDLAVLIDFAHVAIWGIFDRRQGFLDVRALGR